MAWDGREWDLGRTSAEAAGKQSWSGTRKPAREALGCRDCSGDKALRPGLAGAFGDRGTAVSAGGARGVGGALLLEAWSWEGSGLSEGRGSCGRAGGETR